MYKIEKIYDRLSNDIRFIEGSNACMSCGVCTAICPAAEFFEYDPRSITNIVQSGNEEKIQALIESDTIWYCGQCMSCKTRCPRNNFPGLIITVLRKVSQETGAFTKSSFGRKQYLIKKTIGENILKFGYTIHPSLVNSQNHPEQGPVWNWVHNNLDDVFHLTGANLDKEGSGALRKISKNTLEELKEIFDATGATDLFKSIEEFSKAKAIEWNMINDDYEPDMEQYSQFIENE